MRSFLHKFPWRDSVLVILLIVFDVAMHPLGNGPDRLVHDPAVYRLGNPHYLPGDWYTDMAVRSQVYIFYAKLVNAWHWLHIPEELWRVSLYLVSLVILYYAIIRIAQLFTKNILVVPLLVVLHAYLNIGVNQPPWLYGPVIQVDGGLAPRSIGMALSFLGLLFLLRDSVFVMAAIMGLATLIHVSNSFIVFTLFFAVWLIQIILTLRKSLKQEWRSITKKAALTLGIYLIMGGWFAFYVALQGKGVDTFATLKFIWTWVYFRAPYMALPAGALSAKLHFAIKIIFVTLCWLLLRRKAVAHYRKLLDITGLVGVGTLGYFLIFYLFAFVWPWLPGFQFYSFRIIYFAYFVSYLIISLGLLKASEDLFTKLTHRHPLNAKWQWGVTGLVIVAVIIFLDRSLPGGIVISKSIQNVRASGNLLLDDTIIFRSSATEHSRLKPPQTATFQYMLAHPEPFLAPPLWNTSPFYVPSVVSFKSFGFTEEGVVEWFNRLNAVSKGELERNYQSQAKLGHFTPLRLDWVPLYSGLTPQDVVALSQKYHFKLFITYRHLTYPFSVVAEDADYRIYKLP